MIRLIAPPLPAASRPSKITRRRAPVTRVHSCSFDQLGLQSNISASYSSSEILGGFFCFFGMRRQ